MPNIPDISGLAGNVLQSRDWGNGLCSCFDDLGLCLLTYFLPCVTFGNYNL